jgi:uncharacterized protein YjbI with pentapeptide repeats
MNEKTRAADGERDMTRKTDEITNCSNRNHLKPQCEKCFGLCCVALYFSAQDGFPADKAAGTPCQNLDADFRCKIHEQLGAKGLKGCTAYECFGAGQQVSQVTFAGKSWRQEPSSAKSIFEAFLIMQQLHEICWYLTEAQSFSLSLLSPINEEITKLLQETERVTRSDAQALMKFDLSAHHKKVGALLRKISTNIRMEISKENKIPFSMNNANKSTTDYFGKDLRKKDLRCKDLHSSCLIAANLEGCDLTGTDFLGADFRDTNIKRADLSKSIFLTQSQINTTKGSRDTKLPSQLYQPEQWEI